jgi:predicted acyl esterase
VGDDRAAQVGPGALTYTTAPFTAPRLLAGAIDASILLTSTTRDAEIVATLEDVAPGGASSPITMGALLGSLRKVDPQGTWYDSAGKLVKAQHPYTSASATPIASGKLARLDVEIFGTTALIAKGHALRLTIQTSGGPYLDPTASQAANLIGGVYQVQRNSAATSFINLPLVDPARFATGCPICLP